MSGAKIGSAFYVRLSSGALVRVFDPERSPWFSRGPRPADVPATAAPVRTGLGAAPPPLPIGGAPTLPPAAGPAALLVPSSSLSSLERARLSVGLPRRPPAPVARRACPADPWLPSWSSVLDLEAEFSALEDIPYGRARGRAAKKKAVVNEEKEKV